MSRYDLTAGVSTDAANFLSAAIGSKAAKLKFVFTVADVKKNTWFHPGSNSISPIIYCLKRISAPCLEHIDNNVTPQFQKLINKFEPVEKVALEATKEPHRTLYALRYRQMPGTQSEEGNLRIEILYLNTLQETQELIFSVHHLLRASRHLFAA